MIRANTSMSQWRFVSTKFNPADYASRGLSAKKCIECKQWIQGPMFLMNSENDWPAHDIDLRFNQADDQEVKRTVVSYTTNVRNKQSPTNQLLSHFSDWLRLKKAVAWYLKFKDVLRKLAKQRKEMEHKGTGVTTHSRSKKVASKMQVFNSTVSGQNITVEDTKEAEEVIIGISRSQTFPEELAKLQTAPSCVQKTSCIFKLDPVLDNGLLRVGGRLNHAAMPEQSKHPIFLHKNHPISSLILRHIHERTGHIVRNHMLSELRKMYWITNANSAARKVITKCTVCQRVAGRTKVQKMADLPQERLMLIFHPLRTSEWITLDRSK